MRLFQLLVLTCESSDSSKHFTDVESLAATKFLFKGLGSKNYDCRINNLKIDPFVRSSYLFNSGISNIENTDAILLVGTNPRWEASILNARIRKTYLNKDLPIGLIGNMKNLTYKYEHLGQSLNILEDILSENNKFSEKLKKAKKPMIIVGESALTRNDGSAVLHLCSKIAEKFNLVTENWNGFNILNSNISIVGALDIGFFNEKFNENITSEVKKISSNDDSVVFLLGNDEIDLSILNKSFVIYIGHHGDRGAHRADVILPAPAYTEKNSLYVNLEGRVLQSYLCHHPLGDAKDDWKIIKAIGTSLSIDMPFNNINELRNEISKINPIFNELNLLHKNKFSLVGKYGQLSEEPLKDLINNFYMTDPISRSSRTMAECTSYNKLRKE